MLFVGYGKTACRDKRMMMMIQKKEKNRQRWGGSKVDSKSVDEARKPLGLRLKFVVSRYNGREDLSVGL